MASQLQILAGTISDDSAVGTVAWSNPDNAKVSDNVYATVVLAAQVSHYLKATNFGFSIPTGATINGILIEPEVKSVNGVVGYCHTTVKGGIIAGNMVRQNVFYSSDTYLGSMGSPGDLWGRTWTSADINADDFGAAVYIATATDTVSVDHIRITVYYTEVISGPLPIFHK